MQGILMGLRKERGDSQKDLANYLKISEEGYRNKELGKTQFKMDEMYLISERYGMKLDEIFLPRKFTHRVQKQKGGEK